MWYTLIVQVALILGLGVASPKPPKVGQQYKGHDIRFESARLNLDVRLDRQTVNTGEPILFDLSVRNVGKEVVPIPLYLSPCANVFVLIYDEQMNPVHFKDSDIIAEDFLTKVPVLELGQDEFWGTRDVAKMYSATIDKPGNYFLQVVAHLDQEENPTQTAWIGYLGSKQYSVQVVDHKPKPKAP